MRIFLSYLINSIPKVFAAPETAINCEDPALSPKKKLNCLLLSEEELIEASDKSEGTKLAQGDIGTDFIPFFINLGLSIAGTMVFIAFLYAGYLLVFANDKEEDIEKGKKILTYAVVGAIMVAISYALIYGVANLDLD